MNTNTKRRRWTRIMPAMLPLMFGVVYLVVGMMYETPMGSWHGVATAEQLEYRENLPVNLPTWEEHAEDKSMRGCRPKRTPDEFAAVIAVVGMDGRAVKMSFDEAYERNTDDDAPKVREGYQPYGANDVFVIGVC